MYIALADSPSALIVVHRIILKRKIPVGSRANLHIRESAPFVVAMAPSY